MKNPRDKISTQFHKLFCATVKRTAISGAGLASDFGIYQPKVPKRIAK